MGNAVLNRFLNTEIKEIRIFSRDEKKQDDMRQLYQNSKIKYYIGDTREKRSVDAAMNGVNYVFHAATLKQVPSVNSFLSKQYELILWAAKMYWTVLSKKA